MKKQFSSHKKKMTRAQYQKKQRNLKRKTRLRPWAYITLIFIFSVVLIVNLAIIFNWGKDNKKISNIKNELEEVIEVTEVTDDGENVNPPQTKESDYWYYIKVPFYDVKFDSLLEKNSDTIGFINVKGTNINYPIVQSDDNDYYLTHAFDKSKNDAGWVYLDYRNNNQFNDDNSIIYGHGRLNKTVFGSLKNLLTKSWQQNKDNYTISISSPTMNYVYQIFSIYTIESETYYITPTFSNKEDKAKWVSTMKERNVSIINTDVNENDKIITLSTCLNNDGGRIVVHAKMIKQQHKETAD